jgi:chemotaxis protein methyltransferase CheR
LHGRPATKIKCFADTLTPFPKESSGRAQSLSTMAAREKHIRILCTAAAAGQEPYSLAMILKNIGRSLTGWRVEILATDISIAVL